MAESESNHIVPIDHFDGGSNLQRGGEGAPDVKRAGQSLADLLRRRRSGRFTSGGAGDTTITFDEPFVDSSFTVTVCGVALAGATLKAAPTAGTGFTITCTGAGVVHWTAEHDGPTE